MSAIVEYLLSILEGSANLVERFLTFPYVMFGDKDDVGLRQIGEERSFADLARVDHTTIVACTTGNCPRVAALDLHIVNGLAIGRKCVKSYSTSVEIRHTLLRNDLRHAQTIIAKHSTKHDLHAGDIPIKAAVKEHVIHQPKLFDLLKVTTFLLFELDDNHLKSNDLPIFYRAFGFFARLSFLVRAKNIGNTDKMRSARLA